MPIQLVGNALIYAFKLHNMLNIMSRNSKPTPDTIRLNSIVRRVNNEKDNTYDS